MRTGKCWFEKGGFDYFGCVLGVLGLILDPGGVPKTVPARHFGPQGVPKTAQHVKKKQK